MTISIVNHSNRVLLLECLESLRKISDDFSTQIVVLDNASDDGSVEAVRQRFPAVEVIAQPFRSGFGANHNSIIQQTKSRYVYVLNADTLSRPESIPSLIQYMDSNPMAGIAGPRIIGPAGEQQASAWKLTNLRVALAWVFTLGQVGVIQSRGTRAKKVGTVSGCAMVIRREPFERIGLFDESLFMYCEEADIGKRMADLGFEAHYVPDVEVVHYGQQSTGDVPERLINESWRSYRYYFAKHHGKAMAWLLRILTAIGYLNAGIVATLVGALPESVKPQQLRGLAPKVYLRTGVAGLGRINGEGLRESAMKWNRAHGL